MKERWLEVWLVQFSQELCWGNIAWLVLVARCTQQFPARGSRESWPGEGNRRRHTQPHRAGECYERMGWRASQGDELSFKNEISQQRSKRKRIWT